MSVIHATHVAHVCDDVTRVWWRHCDVCVAVVRSPAGEHLSPQLIDRRDGCVLVRCVPTQPGLHHLDVSYNDVPVHGSPWQFHAETVHLAQLRAYGAGLSHGVATAPCQFTVHSHDNTPGQTTLFLSLCLCLCLSVCLSISRPGCL